MTHSRRHRMKRSRRQTRNLKGGFMSPTAWDKSDMSMASADSFRQAQQYLNIHKGQHGGSAPYPAGVTNSVLTGPMVASARTGPLDAAVAQIQGMSDQSGGKRSKSRKNKAKAKRSRRNKKLRGGSMAGSPLSANSMLLPEGTKGTGLHADWAAAMNPNSLVPK